MKKTLYILFLAPLCVLSILTIAYLFSKDEPLFFLKNVKVSGVSQLSERDVMSRVTPYLKESLLKVDIEKIKEAIATHPFVREVRVKRAYPFSVVIDVKEKVPSALWVKNDGDVFVLDESGEPYRKMGRGNIKGLFIINAKEKTDAASIFRQVNAWSTEGIIKKESLSEAAYNEGSLTLFGLDDGVEIILGKEEQKKRLKRAVAVLGDAKKRGLLIKCIDARFEKGAIIQERKG
ncbi:MAG: FtsQ-type POTRA domain-containing protein [Syntrophorhabdaceae bacterium]|nr:FtsQ-type POTRA domain-containing protein [Syntrophorhabdaceae bacterium]MDD5243925.1 FtsQ-type POTRA domain-containing protein [Syntrophorhabdaceae bacterium]